MHQVDSFLQSFSDFFKRFYQTFLWTLFKPTKVLGLLRDGNATKHFVGVYAYLYISTYFSFIVFSAGELGFLSGLDFKSYIEAYQKINGSSLIFYLVIAIPHSALICFLISIAIKFLHFGRRWFPIVFTYAIYYFSSLILITVMFSGFLVAFLAIDPFVEECNSYVGTILKGMMVFALYILPIILAAVPFFFLFRYYYKISIMRLLQYTVLLLSCLLLAWYDYIWFDKLNSTFENLRESGKTAETIDLFNYDGSTIIQLKQIDSGKIRSLINVNILISNNTKHTYILPAADSIIVHCKLRGTNSKECLFKLGIVRWENEEQMISFILRPGDIKHIQATGYANCPGMNCNNAEYSCKVDISMRELHYDSTSTVYLDSWKGYVHFTK